MGRIARLGEYTLYYLFDLGRMGKFLFFAVRGFFARPFRLVEV